MGTHSIEIRAGHWSCYDGDHSSVLALLVDAGASVGPSAIDGRTSLILAACYGRRRCVALIIARGGDALDLNARQTDGSTAL